MAKIYQRDEFIVGYEGVKKSRRKKDDDNEEIWLKEDADNEEKGEK